MAVRDVLKTLVSPSVPSDSKLKSHGERECNHHQMTTAKNEYSRLLLDLTKRRIQVSEGGRRRLSSGGCEVCDEETSVLGLGRGGPGAAMHKHKAGSQKKANATGSGADRYGAWQWAITRDI
jgi:hypothetical protein